MYSVTQSSDEVNVVYKRKGPHFRIDRTGILK